MAAPTFTAETLRGGFEAPRQDGEARPDGEVYAKSLRMLLQWGGLLAMRGAGYNSPEAYLEAAAAERAARTMVEDDLGSAVRENLGSSNEVDKLHAEWFRVRKVKNGQVVAADGTPVVDIIERGIEYSDQAARKNPAMAAQLRRDQLDLLVAKTADSLNPGEAYFTLSMDPKEALETYPGVYEELGYRAGEARLQVYARFADGSALAGSIAVNNSNPAVLRKVLKEKLGIEIPENISCDEWTQYGARLSLSPEAATARAHETQQCYYEAIGLDHKRVNVDEFVSAHKGVVGAYFDRYMAPLALAIYTRRNHPALQSLAVAVQSMPNFQRLRQIRDAVSLAATEPTFTPEMGRAMEQVIRYALIEELRHHLEPVLYGQPNQSPAPSYDTLANLPLELLALRLAGNVQAGIKAGHNYGGCAGMRIAGQDGETEMTSPQDAYGSKDTSSKEESDGEECDYFHKNCYCSPFNYDGTRRGTNMVVRARKTSQGAYCMRPGCGACILNSGYVDKGKIAARAEQRRREQAA